MPRTLVLLLAIPVVARVAAARAEPVTLKARPFALSDVRLLDGPFKDAMAVDRAFLLRLDVDRLMHSMRLTAGLEAR